MTSRDNNLLNISWFCEIAGVSRSGYYRWLTAENARNTREGQDKTAFALVLEAYKHRGTPKAHAEFTCDCCTKHLP
jgi:putative transposase